MLVWMLGALAWAGPFHAVGATANVNTADTAGTVHWRMRFEDGVQLGASFRAAGIRLSFLDGWPIRAGQSYTGTLDLGLPIVKTERVQVDLELELGARGVIATDTDADADRSVILVSDVRPMVTMPVHDIVAVRVGWTHVLHQQVGPSYALEAQGVVARAEVVTGLTDAFQLVVGGETGGVFGFNGDGGKFLAGGHLSLLWVPGAARTWMNH
jgi:hypothetical protein